MRRRRSRWHRRWVATLVLAGLTMALGAAPATADEGCVGRVASSLAPALRHEFGQLNRLEAQAGTIVDELHWLLGVEECPL